MKINSIVPVSFGKKTSGSVSKPKAAVIPQDKIVIDRNACSENMSKLDDIEKGHSLKIKNYLYKGDINGKASILKESETKMNFFGTKRHYAVKGTIGDKKIHFEQDTESASLLRDEHKIKGKYADKEFDLEFKPSISLLKGESVLKGKINEEEVSFSFPGSEVPKDDDVKDIISAILVKNGFTVLSVNGRFTNPGYASWFREEHPDLSPQRYMNYPNE